MLVNHVATMQLQSIQADAPVREAAQKMQSADIGLLLVAKGNDLVGVVTDRDIVTRSVASGDCICGGTVGQIMSKPVVCIAADAELTSAARLMSEKSVRRVIVLNDQKVPIGVLSLDDIAFATHGDETAAQVLEDLAHGPQSLALFRSN